MRKTLFIFVVLLCVFSLYGLNLKSKEMYFVSGTPTPLSDSTFSSKLYKIDIYGERVLKFVRELSSKNDGSDFIRSYYDERLVVIASPSIKPDRLTIVRMDAPIEDKVFYFKEDFCSVCSVVGRYVINQSNKKYIFLSFFRGDDASFLKAFDLEGGIPVDKGDLDLKDVVVSGIPGGVISGDTIYMASDADGKLYFLLGGNKIDTDWVMPKDFMFSEKDIIVAYVNTKDMLVLSSKENKKRDLESIGSSTYYVFNKNSFTWNKITFPGGRSEIRSFGNWIVGYVAGMGAGSVITGAEISSKEMSDTGSPIEWRIDMANIFLSGELFVYNIKNNQSYLINTGERNSEILLVDDGYIYYRSDDNIFRQKIHDKLEGDKELLLKSNIVRDIHWAFWGG